MDYEKFHDSYDSILRAQVMEVVDGWERQVTWIQRFAGGVDTTDAPDYYTDDEMTELCEVVEAQHCIMLYDSILGLSPNDARRFILSELTRQHSGYFPVRPARGWRLL